MMDNLPDSKNCSAVLLVVEVLMNLSEEPVPGIEPGYADLQSAA
jgi:hypothetical protein